MRLHISLDDDLVAALDRRIGRRRRSAFIARTVERALEDEHRWDEVIESLGRVENAGHGWDDDAAGWVRAQRRGDGRRVG